MALTLHLGSDPEVFVVDRNAGHIVPSYDVISYWQERGILTEGATSLRIADDVITGDGAALEWVTPPQQEASLLRLNIQRTARRIQDLLPPHWALSALPYAQVREEDRERLTDAYGKTFSLQMFGCSPDLIVYPGTEFERSHPMQTLARTAGGHIHMELGALAQDFEAVSFVTALYDLFLGCTSTYWFASEPLRQRMSLYGYPGTIRLHAMLGRFEYRVLPSIALVGSGMLSSQLLNLARQLAYTAVQLYTYNKDTFFDWAAYVLDSDTQRFDALIQAIVTADTQAALALYQAGVARLRKVVSVVHLPQDIEVLNRVAYLTSMANSSMTQRYTTIATAVCQRPLMEVQR
jgi:hypothetical protein